MDVNYFVNVAQNNVFQFKYNLGQEWCVCVGGGGAIELLMESLEINKGILCMDCDTQFYEFCQKTCTRWIQS